MLKINNNDNPDPSMFMTQSSYEPVYLCNVPNIHLIPSPRCSRPTSLKHVTPSNLELACLYLPKSSKVTQLRKHLLPLQCFDFTCQKGRANSCNLFYLHSLCFTQHANFLEFWFCNELKYGSVALQHFSPHPNTPHQWMENLDGKWVSGPLS